MPLTPAQQSYRQRLTAESGALTDPDATGCAPVGTGGAGRVMRFPLRLRIAPAAVALPMIAPTPDEAADAVDRVRAGCRFDDMPCGGCALYQWSRDDQASRCTWGERPEHRVEDCDGFDADRFDMLAWHRITADVCAVQPREVA